MLQSVRLIQKQSDNNEFRDELNELRKLDQSRQKELRLLYNQLKQLMQVNESMQVTIDSKIHDISRSIDPVVQQLEIQKHQQNQLASEVNSILEIVDEKFKRIETVQPQSAKEVAALLKPELDSVSKKLYENSMRLTEIHHKVLENEQKQKTFTKNINERFDNVVAMLREEMHAVSKNKVDSMLRKLIDYMKQTI
jgi:methyl-accepting chemotaxis protein